MLDNFIFENHLGLRFVGLENGVYMNYNAMRDYVWNYDTINSRISRFYRPVQSQKIPLVVYCTSETEAISVKNRLHELAESDIIAKIPGKIYIGDYYISGYITGSAKENYLVTKRLCNLTLTFVSDNWAWYRDQKHVFKPNSATENDLLTGIDYPFDYPYDYALAISGRRVKNDSIGSSGFRMLIYGEVTDPSIIVGEHVYTVKGYLRQGETLMIDSLTKTITFTDIYGKKENWFDRRGREDYIFEPIPPGQNIIKWDGLFGFDLTVVEERSEPRWT